MKQFHHNPLSYEIPELEAVTFPDGRRIYKTPAGNTYHSMTTALSLLNEKGLQSWRDHIGDDEADRIRDAACVRGNKLHYLIECYLKNEPLEFTDKKVQIIFNRMREILDPIDNIMAQEIALFSDQLQVAGRCDCIGDYDGVPSIIDFKGSNKAKKKENILSYFLQTSGYSVMLQERTGIEINQIVILVGNEDFGRQVFVEDRRNYLTELHRVVSSYINIKGDAVDVKAI